MGIDEKINRFIMGTLILVCIVVLPMIPNIALGVEWNWFIVGILTILFVVTEFLAYRHIFSSNKN